MRESLYPLRSRFSLRLLDNGIAQADVVADDELGTITGMIDDIVAGGKSMSDVIRLNGGTITATGGFSGNARMGAATVKDNMATYTYNGHWGGQFYGPAAEELGLEFHSSVILTFRSKHADSAQEDRRGGVRAGACFAYRPPFRSFMCVKACLPFEHASFLACLRACFCPRRRTRLVAFHGESIVILGPLPD